jgi:hypothetical protein
MPERDQDQGRVPVTIAAVLGGLGQLLDFGRREVFARPQFGVGRASRQRAWATDRFSLHEGTKASAGLAGILTSVSN